MYCRDFGSFIQSCLKLLHPPNAKLVLNHTIVLLNLRHTRWSLPKTGHAYTSFYSAGSSRQSSGTMLGDNTGRKPLNIYLEFWPVWFILFNCGLQQPLEYVKAGGIGF